MSTDIYEVPKPIHPDTIEELADYISSLVGSIDWDTPAGDGPAGDGTGFSLGYQQSAEATYLAAGAAFNYVARAAGITGFQAGWAAFQFMREVQNIKGPFGIVRADPDMLYPQYGGPAAKAAEWAEEWAEWAGEEAARLLEESPGAVPQVRKHWERLVADQKEKA